MLGEHIIDLQQGRVSKVQRVPMLKLPRWIAQQMLPHALDNKNVVIICPMTLVIPITAHSIEQMSNLVGFAEAFLNNALTPY